MLYPQNPWRSLVDVPLAFGLWLLSRELFQHELQDAGLLVNDTDAASEDPVFGGECVTFLACLDRTPLPRDISAGMFGIPKVKLSHERGMLGDIQGVANIASSVLPALFSIAAPAACSSTVGLTSLWYLSRLGELYRADTGIEHCSLLATTLERSRPEVPALNAFGQQLVDLNAAIEPDSLRPGPLAEFAFQSLDGLVRVQSMRMAQATGQKGFREYREYCQRAARAAYDACDRVTSQLVQAGESHASARLLSSMKFARTAAETSFDHAVSSFVAAVSA